MSVNGGVRYTCKLLASRFVVIAYIVRVNVIRQRNFFPLFKYKVIGSDVHSTSVYDKRDDVGFHNVNCPWLSGDVPRLSSYGVYISQLVRLARCCTSVSDFNSKNIQITSKLLTQGLQIIIITDITSFEKHSEGKIEVPRDVRNSKGP